MMLLPPINTSVAATRATAEGQTALGLGDTLQARAKFAEAGAILERAMKAHHGGSEKQILRFLAATQYYKGGDYQKAQGLAKQIDARALPKNVRGLLPQFLKDVKERASPGYAMSIRRTVHSLWSEKKYRDAIDKLKDHPFVYDAAGLAFLRAVLCERLGDYRAASLFFRSMIRFTSGASDAIFMAVAYPLALTTQGRAVEAWEYVQKQLELLPHPATYVTASVVCYHCSIGANSEDRKKWLEELLTFIEKAWAAYQKLPSEQQNHPDMQSYMAFGYEVAAGAWLLQGDKGRGKEAWNQAIRLDANLKSPWTVSDFATVQSDSGQKADKVEYLSERETHFSARFTPEPTIRQQLEAVGA